MSKKDKKIFPIKIFCEKCDSLLYEYNKEGGGALIKCFVDRIRTDHTNGDMKCPKCGQEFARLKAIKNRPIHKIIQGKVYIRGHCKK